MTKKSLLSTSSCYYLQTYSLPWTKNLPSTTKRRNSIRTSKIKHHTYTHIFSVTNISCVAFFLFCFHFRTNLFLKPFWRNVFITWQGRVAFTSHYSIKVFPSMAGSAPKFTSEKNNKVRATGIALHKKINERRSKLKNRIKTIAAIFSQRLSL